MAGGAIDQLWLADGVVGTPTISTTFTDLLLWQWSHDISPCRHNNRIVIGYQVRN
jgi:hypothetical protein